MYGNSILSQNGANAIPPWKACWKCHSWRVTLIPMHHFEHLESHIPDLRTRRILDLGSGKGKFLFYCAEHGIPATGLEVSSDYVTLIKERAKKEGRDINIIQGRGEALPFPDASFDFINVSEVIEHVEDPKAMLAEIFRVLAPGGAAYLSVPNRFGWKDPHFHLIGVNWLPRSLSASYIALFGRHKDYSSDGAGYQRLDQMHYATWGQIARMLKEHGFRFEDQRIVKIRKRLGAGPLAFLAILCYLPFRMCYFDAFHILLSKPR